MGNGLVRCDLDHEVATITLASPASRNALSAALLADLHDALDTATAPGVRAVVLTHEPPVFCAGADLKERSAGGPGTPVPGSERMVGAIRRIMDADQPVIAAVKGPVRAGGLGVMAACDLVVVAPEVDFAFTEVRIGLAPAIIAVPILRRVPATRLAAAFLTGERFDAATAREIGLVSHVAASVDDVDAVVAGLVSGILLGAPAAVARAKRILREVPGPDLTADFERMHALSDEMFRSEDGMEGMRSFLERRPPSWQVRG